MSAAPDKAAPTWRDNPRLIYVKIYFAVYLVLALAQLVFKLTGSAELPLDKYLADGFPGAAQYVNAEAPAATLPDPAALQQAMRPEAALVRLWTPLSFQAPDRINYALSAGQQLTPPEAVALARSLIKDAGLPAGQKQFGAKLRIYGGGFLGAVPWEYLLNSYNILGMFLLAFVFLKEPLLGLLDASRSQVSGSLVRAREAQAKAEAIRRRRSDLEGEISSERQQLEEKVGAEAAAEGERIIALAKHEAAGLLEAVKSGVEAEVAAATEKLRARIAAQALEQAREMLAKEVAAADHDAAVGAFLDQLPTLEKR